MAASFGGDDLVQGAFWLELDTLLNRGFNGQVTLHCREGQVVKYDVLETRHPAAGNGHVDRQRGSG